MSRHAIPLSIALTLLAVACSSAGEGTTTSEPVTTTAVSSQPTAPPITGASTTTTTTPATTATETTTTTESAVTQITVAVQAGSVAVERFDVPLGATVRLIVTADVTDEIHVHGYDLRAEVSPAADGVVEFDATIPGIFEVELEESHLLIAELQVAP